MPNWCLSAGEGTVNEEYEIDTIRELYESWWFLSCHHNSSREFNKYLIWFLDFVIWQIIMGTNQLSYEKNGPIMSNYVQKKLSFFAESQIPAQFDGEPIENLSKRHKTDSNTKSTGVIKIWEQIVQLCPTITFYTIISCFQLSNSCTIWWRTNRESQQ